MGTFSRLVEIFKAMANDGPDGALDRFRVASQGSDGGQRPSRNVIEAVLASPTKEAIPTSGDVVAHIANLGDGWYYCLIGGGVAAFASGGPFADRAAVLRAIGVGG